MNKDKIHIQFIFTRYGYSHNNFIYDVEYIYQKKGINYPNTIITNVDIKQSHELNYFMKKNKIVPDIVICSKLKRAIEIAVITYKDIVDQVYPVPFIYEFSNEMKSKKKRV
jgi:hypothetical protein